jgi:hypothetical protein
VVIGPWFAFNTLRYGDPLRWQIFHEVNDGSLRPASLGLAEFVAGMPQLAYTFWGGAGFEFPLTQSVNAPLLAALVFALAGVAAGLLRRRFPREAWLLFVAVATVTGPFIWWTRDHYYPNLRYYAPVWTALSAVLAIGLLSWFPDRWRRWIAGGASAALLAGAVAMYALVLQPLGAGPDYVPAAQAAVLPSPAARFDNGIELISADIQQRSLDSGAEANIVFFWRATRELTQTEQLVLEARDEDGATVGQLNTTILPQRRYQVVRWRPGSVRRVAAPAGATDASAVAKVRRLSETPTARRAGREGKREAGE